MNIKRTILFLALALSATLAAAQGVKGKVQLDIDVKERGVYSISICDADAVLPDSLQANAVAQLLLCSEIRGTVENPNYYFCNPTRQKDAELDLLMMTQGWRRYEAKDIVNETYPRIDHNIETSQTISGHVERTLSKSPQNLKLLLLSPSVGGKQEFQLQDSSRFTIDGLDFADGTPFTLQATTQKGRTNFIQIYVDPDSFPRIRPLAAVRSLPVAERFAEQSRNQRRVSDIRNMQYLDEVVVTGRRILNPLGFLPDNILGEGDRWLENSPVSKLVAQRIGLQVTGADGMEQIIGRFHHKPNGKMEMKPCLIIIDDFKATQEEFLRLPAESIRQVELFKDNTAIPMIYGFPDDFPYQNYSRTGEFDCLLVYTKPMARISGRSLSAQNVRPLGYSQPVEFYSPQYPSENKNLYPYPDYRTTLYWNPALQVGENGTARLDFYNSDTATRYLITIEGVSDEGKIISETKILGELKK